MAIPKQMNPQDDFSAGELDAEFTRNDDPISKLGARQMRNWRILNSKKPTNRPGRSAKYVQDGRVDKVLVLPGVIYDLCFGGDGSLKIRNSVGSVVASLGAASYPWRTATVDQIVWTLVKTGASSSDVVICFPGMKTTTAKFDGAAWTFISFAFQTGADGIPLVPFYRIAAPGIVMTTNITAGVGGAVNVLFDGDVLLPSHVGAIFRFAGARLQITGYSNPRLGTAIALEQMFALVNVNVTSSTLANAGSYRVGQLVQGNVSSTKGIITQINVGSYTITVQTIFLAPGFVVGESLVSATAALVISGTAILSAPDPIAIWDEQIVSDARGWPQSCSTDQNRLIFCDLPGVPEAVMWSASGQPYNHNIGANPTDAMVETCSGKPRIYHVVPADGGEMVVTDRGIQYVPISETNPLKPGSVVFRHISPDAAARVRPVRTSEGVLFVNAGLNRVVAAIGSGASYAVKPYAALDITESHTHLFSSIKALAVTAGDGQFAERYIYALNADGSIAVGKFDQGKTVVGWVPWSGAGTPNWLSALQSVMTLTTSYPTSGAAVSVAEQLDATQYVDAGLLINAVPAALAPPGGKGPLWWMPGASVDLIDGVRTLGQHVVDADGFITLLDPSEVLTSPTIVAGMAWTATFEPFIFNPPGGEDHQQRMRRRKIVRAAVSARNSTGYVMAGRRIPAYFVGDNPTLPPPLREHTETFRPHGRAYDPRVVLTKDTPGPLTIIELGIEATV